MPLIEVRLLEGVFNDAERQQLAEGLIDAVVGVKGESFRTETEVLITTVPGRQLVRARCAHIGRERARRRQLSCAA